MKKLITLLAALVISCGLYSQLYHFSTNSGTYKDLNGAVSLTDGQPFPPLTYKFEIPLDFDFIFFCLMESPTG